MKFGEFYTDVCNRLKSEHGWKGPISYLALKFNLLDILYEEYVIAATSQPDTDWKVCVEETALKIQQA